MVLRPFASRERSALAALSLEPDEPEKEELRDSSSDEGALSPIAFECVDAPVPNDPAPLGEVALLGEEEVGLTNLFFTALSSVVE